MGLAAPRKRVKLSRDPNNTKWAQDTESFGHKSLTAQGWQPGDFLGAKNAAHAGLHTAANASHIRVTVKDDTLGLGAKRGSGLAEGECTGLDVFQSLLGRLNGKSEDHLAMEEKNREDLKRTIYNEQRWGSVRFVKGGFLIGDKIQEQEKKEEVDIHQMCEAWEGNALIVKVEESPENPPKHKERKRKGREKELESAELLLEKPTISRTENQSRQVSPCGTSEGAVEGELTDFLEGKMNPVPTDRDEKRKVKEKKKKRNKLRGHGEPLVEPQLSPSTTLDASSTPQALLGGRHAVRSRNIAQKRLAVLDTASLNQIFMIKK